MTNGSSEASSASQNTAYQHAPIALSTDLGIDGVIAMDTDLATYFGMKETAAAIWHSFIEPAFVDDVVAALEARYRADEGVIETDVWAFVDRLIENRLLVASTPS